MIENTTSSYKLRCAASVLRTCSERAKAVYQDGKWSHENQRMPLAAWLLELAQEVDKASERARVSEMVSDARSDWDTVDAIHKYGVEYGAANRAQLRNAAFHFVENHCLTLLANLGQQSPQSRGG